MLTAHLYLNDNKTNEKYRDRVRKVVNQMNEVRKNIKLKEYIIREERHVSDNIDKWPTLVLKDSNKELFRWQGVYTESSLWWKIIRYMEK